MSKYLYYKVRCEEVGYSSGSLGTTDDAYALIGFIIDHTNTGIIFEVVGFNAQGLPTVVEELRRETRQEELERIEKLFHYQESVEGLYP